MAEFRNTWHILQLWDRVAQADPLAHLPPHRLDLHLPLPCPEDHLRNLPGFWWVSVFFMVIGGFWCLSLVLYGYRCFSLGLFVFFLWFPFQVQVQKIISGIYQETIAGRVCTLQTLSLVNEVSRKTLIGAQWYTHIANVFNLYWSYKVHSFRKSENRSIVEYHTLWSKMLWSQVRHYMRGICPNQQMTTLGRYRRKLVPNRQRDQFPSSQYQTCTQCTISQTISFSRTWNKSNTLTRL